MKIMKALIIPFALFGLFFHPVCVDAENSELDQSKTADQQMDTQDETGDEEQIAVSPHQNVSEEETKTFYEWFPDDHLAECVAAWMPGFMLPTDQVSLEQLSQLEVLSCAHSDVTDLSGLEYLTGLTYFDCADNQITKLDISQNPNISELYCSRNSLTELRLGPSVETVECNDNQLTTIDASLSPNLTYLYCFRNQLTELNVSESKNLASLICYDNQLTALDVSGCSNLDRLDFDHNQISEIDISQNPHLHAISCADNKLSALDISRKPELFLVNCPGNQIANLNLSQTPELEYMYLDNNQLQNFSSIPSQYTDFSAVNQNVTLEAQVSKNKTLTIPVSEELKDENGNPMNITVTDGGIYDPDTNTITWENLDASGTVQYHFASESTHCSGTVTVPYQESKPMTLQVDEEITYDKAAVISEQQFLQDIHATTEEGNELSSDFADVVDFSTPGDYEVTVTASNDKESVEKKVIVHIKAAASNDIPVPPVAPDQPSDDGSADGDNHSKDKAEGKASDTSDLTINETEVSNVNSSSLPKTGDQASLGWTVLGSITITLAGIYLLRRKK